MSICLITCDVNLDYLVEVVSGIFLCSKIKHFLFVINDPPNLPDFGAKV